MEALKIINDQTVDEIFDKDTSFCIKWFEEYGWLEGDYGNAETLAKPKGVAVEGVCKAGVLHAKGGRCVCSAITNTPTTGILTMTADYPLGKHAII